MAPKVETVAMTSRSQREQVHLCRTSSSSLHALHHAPHAAWVSQVTQHHLVSHWPLQIPYANIHHLATENRTWL